jgi:hypothetical protein
VAEGSGAIPISQKRDAGHPDCGGVQLFGGFGEGDWEFEGADFVGGGVVDAGANEEGAGGEVERLEEDDRGLEEPLVAVVGEGHLDGLADAGEEVAVAVVGGEIEVEGAVVDSLGVGGEEELAGGDRVVEDVAGEGLALEFGVEDAVGGGRERGRGRGLFGLEGEEELGEDGHAAAHGVLEFDGRGGG